MLASVDSRLRLYRDNAYCPFGGIPIIIFFGDFFQFDPIRQTSLLLPEPKDSNRQRPESLVKYLIAYKLFLQFTAIVILREQVRTAGCARLRGFLHRLRNGQQTELDYQRLCRRLYNKESQPSFADGLRAVTPLNQNRWSLNIAAVVQYGPELVASTSPSLSPSTTSSQEGDFTWRSSAMCSVMETTHSSQPQACSSMHKGCRL